MSVAMLAMEALGEPANDTPAAKRLCLSLRKKPSRSLKQTTLFDRPTESSASLNNELPPSPPFAGLQNTGNTCYFNALVQFLRYVPAFVSALTKDVENRRSAKVGASVVMQRSNTSTTLCLCRCH